MTRRIAALGFLLLAVPAKAQDCVPFALPKAGTDATYSYSSGFITGTIRVQALTATATETTAQITSSLMGQTQVVLQKLTYQTTGGNLVLVRSDSSTPDGTLTRSSYSPGLVAAPLTLCAGTSYSIPSVTQLNETLRDGAVVATSTSQTSAETANVIAVRESLTLAGRTFAAIHERRQTVTGTRTSDLWTSDGLLLRQRTTEGNTQTNIELTSLSGGETCPTPGAVTVTAPSRDVVAGSLLAVEWSRAQLIDGYYKVLLSRPSGHDTVIQTTDSSILIPTEPSSTAQALTLRVRAVESCGSESGDSSSITFALRPTPDSFVVTKGLTTFAADAGGSFTPQLLALRNTGARPLDVTARVQGLDAVTLEPTVINLLPYVDKPITVSPASRTPGTTSGSISLNGGGVTAAPGLTLVQSSPLPSGVTIRVSPSELIFRGAAGEPPPSQQVTLQVDGLPATGGPYFLAPIAGPDCELVRLGGAISQPLANGTSRIDVQKLRSPSGLAEIPRAPGVCRIDFPAPGNAVPATLDVLSYVDMGTRPGAFERGSATAVVPPPGGTSIIIPSEVNLTTGSGQTFVSDGWLTNLGPTEARIDFYCTPEGKDGLSDPGVVATTLRIEPGRTYRLADTLQGVYSLTSASSQLELRSPSISFLSFRAAVASQLSGDRTSLYGSEIPAVAYGAGIGRGQGELVVPGIDNDAANRANLILAETTGKQATLSVSVNGPDGQRLGTIAGTVVPPYGKVQINRVAEAAGVAALSGGWAGVAVTAGDGRVVAVATVIDNRSGSFSAVLGRGSRPASRPALRAGGSFGLEPLAASAKYVLPTAVRTTGANNTLFTTNLSLVNGVASPASLTLTYVYTDLDDGGKSKTARKTITIPGRGALPKAQGTDAMVSLFGVTNRSFGYIVVEGDTQKVVGVVAISALVDPTDVSKGVKTAQVNGVFLDSKTVLRTPGHEVRFAGAEKSTKKRTNLILLELSGQGADVNVRLRGADGTTLAKRTMRVEAGQYLQINDVFGDQGVALGDGPFQDVQVSAELVSTGAQILSFATVNDNLSRNPEIFVLQPAGPPVDSTIGF